MIIKKLGLQPYHIVWKKMQDFTANRTSDTPDELWMVQHLPVFTQGQAGKSEHLLAPGDIPVIQTDRGGQATYHGPGQLVIYVLVDLRRKNLGIKALTHRLEQSMIDLLNYYDIPAERQSHAPGVYVQQAKIAFLGLRIRRGCSYHGCSLNVAMDLKPFSRIHPCGYPNLQVVQMRDFAAAVNLSDVEVKILPALMHYLD